MQLLHTFYSAHLAEDYKKQCFDVCYYDYYFYLCTMQPLEGAVERKYRAILTTPDIFLFFSELFPENIWWFQGNVLYLQHPTKYSNNDNDFIKETILARYGVESGNAPMPYYMA